MFLATAWAWALRNPLNLALGGLAAVFFAAAAWQTVARAQAERALADERLASANATLRALDAAHQRERAMQAQRDAAHILLEVKHAELQHYAQRNAALLAEIDRLRGAVRVAVSDADGLRQRLAAYAAGAAGDPGATCEHRAARLGAYAADLGVAAAEVAESAGEVAAAAQLAAGERDATAARFVACVKAWPR